MTHAWRADPLRRAICRYALALPLLPLASRVRAQATSEPVDLRAGSLRIDVSLATSAMTKLVKGLNKHFPKLKIEFVRAGSVETVKRFVAERSAGLIGADLIHGADPGGFDYFAQKGWVDKSLTELSLVADYRDGFYDKNDGWIALRATGIAIMYTRET